MLPKNARNSAKEKSTVIALRTMAPFNTLCVELMITPRAGNTNRKSRYGLLSRSSIEYKTVDTTAPNKIIIAALLNSVLIIKSADIISSTKSPRAMNLPTRKGEMNNMKSEPTKPVITEIIKKIIDRSPL